MMIHHNVVGDYDEVLTHSHIQPFVHNSLTQGKPIMLLLSFQRLFVMMIHHNVVGDYDEVLTHSHIQPFVHNSLTQGKPIMLRCF